MSGRLSTLLDYGYHPGGGASGAMGSVMHFLARAAAWSAVRRFMYALPGGWLLVVFGAAVVVMFFARVRRRR